MEDGGFARVWACCCRWIRLGFKPKNKKTKEQENIRPMNKKT